MDIEAQYRVALDLTHQMLGAATGQEWERLTLIEKQRSLIVERIARTKLTVPPANATRIAEIIAEMESENAEIMERVKCWQEHVKILLRMKD